MQYFQDIKNETNEPNERWYFAPKKGDFWLTELFADDQDHLLGVRFRLVVDEQEVFRTQDIGSFVDKNHEHQPLTKKNVLALFLQYRMHLFLGVSKERLTKDMLSKGRIEAESLSASYILENKKNLTHASVGRIKEWRGKGQFGGDNTPPPTNPKRNLFD